jgi:hypothetical protein
MKKNTDILDRITPEEIEEWMLATMAKHNLTSVSVNALEYPHQDAGCYWTTQTDTVCGLKNTLTEAIESTKAKMDELAARPKKEAA